MSAILKEIAALAKGGPIETIADKIGVDLEDLFRVAFEQAGIDLPEEMTDERIKEALATACNDFTTLGGAMTATAERLNVEYSEVLRVVKESPAKAVASFA